MAAEGAFVGTADGQHGLPAMQIAFVGTKFNTLHVQCFKSILQHEKFATFIHACSLKCTSEPGVSDLQHVVGVLDIIIACAACIGILLFIPYDERKFFSGGTADQCGADIMLQIIRSVDLHEAVAP